MFIQWSNINLMKETKLKKVSNFKVSTTLTIYSWETRMALHDSDLISITKELSHNSRVGQIQQLSNLSPMLVFRNQWWISTNQEGGVRKLQCQSNIKQVEMNWGILFTLNLAILEHSWDICKIKSKLPESLEDLVEIPLQIIG
jgi:hypothetical protein